MKNQLSKQEVRELSESEVLAIVPVKYHITVSFGYWVDNTLVLSLTNGNKVQLRFFDDDTVDTHEERSNGKYTSSSNIDTSLTAST